MFTFEDLLLLGLDEGVPEGAGLAVVDQGARLMDLLLVESLVVRLPLLVEDSVKLGKCSIHL